VLHFAPPPGEGETDPRTRRLIAALSLSSLPRGLVYVSTSGVFGDCQGQVVSETRPALPHNARAKRRWDAERRLRAWAASSGVRLAILRAPGIYAGDRMPAERVRKAMPALLPEEDIYTNHIHAEDLAGLAITALFRAGANRVYNAVDDSGLKMGDWFDVVADHLGLPRPPRLSRDEVMAAVTPAMRSFLSESRRLSNRRIKAELRYRHRYPTAQATLGAKR
jgi:nucleoside-diphosphate-sugar epimerase